MKAAAFLAGAVLLGLAVPAAAAEVEARAWLEPEVIGVDETATLSIEAHGDDFSSLRFQPSFELINLEVVAGPNKFEDLRYSNGSLSRTLRVSWQVRPLAVGKAGIRSVSLQIRDEIVQLQPQEIRVQRQPVRQPLRRLAREEDDPFQEIFGRIPRTWRQEPAPPEVFLRADVQPRQPVVGQQVIYTLYLYTRADIAALSPSGVPTFHGFWVQDIPIPQQIPTEMVESDGRRYGRVPLLRKALFPLRPGRFKVEPAVVDLTVQRYDRNFFFGPPIARPEQVRLQTEAQAIDVQPLPAAPPGFGGAVGQLALTADLQPKQVRLGEAATLTVRLSGAGNLQGVREPDVTPPAGVTVHPPQQEGKDEINGTTVRGSRTWKYVVVPDRAGSYTLDTPEITYFDPGVRQYRVAASPDLTLTALPRATSVAETAAGEPHGIRTAALSLPAFSGSRWTTLLPWLFILPWGLALIVTLARRRSPPARTGGAAAPTAAGTALEERLRQAESEERPRQVALRLEEAWRELLAERWGIPPATPFSRWRELLAADRVDAGILDDLDRLVEDLQYLRYAPQLSATGSLRDEVISRSRRLLRRLP
ncbi:MAG TPA: BatD family protein [Thermoanaerobaculia bacterium]|nr:BatD family protein [Thermoanaerobaculia bacterium]